MFNLAEDSYPQGQSFNEPWPFWIVDDFLKPHNIQTLKNFKDVEQFNLVDKSDGRRVVTLNAPYNKYDIKIRPNKHPKAYVQLKDNAVKSLTKVISFEELKKLTFVFDLVYCEPKYTYHKHSDHPDKLYSIVVYLGPEDGDGTILFDQDDKQYNVVWKPNRAFIFKSNPHGYHFYTNTKNVNRYTLNLYLTDGPINFGVTSKGKEEHDLSKYR